MGRSEPRTQKRGPAFWLAWAILGLLLLFWLPFVLRIVPPPWWMVVMLTPLPLALVWAVAWLRAGPRLMLSTPSLLVLWWVLTFITVALSRALGYGVGPEAASGSYLPGVVTGIIFVALAIVQAVGRGRWRAQGEESAPAGEGEERKRGPVVWLAWLILAVTVVTLLVSALDRFPPWLFWVILALPVLWPIWGLLWLRAKPRQKLAAPCLVPLWMGLTFVLWMLLTGVVWAMAGGMEPGAYPQAGPGPDLRMMAPVGVAVFVALGATKALAHRRRRRREQGAEPEATPVAE